MATKKAAKKPTSQMLDALKRGKGGYSAAATAEVRELKRKKVQRLGNRKGIFQKGKDRRVKISARNILRGKVKKVKHGAVNSEVTIELPGRLEIAAIITKDSAERLRLSAGQEAYAIIKATDVIIGTN